MTIKLLIVERLDGWIYSWGNVPDDGTEFEMVEPETPYETFDEAVKAGAESIRGDYPLGTLQGDEGGKGDVGKSGQRKHFKT